MSHLRFDRTLLTVILGLTALFTILDPPASARLPLLATALFWFLHIGTGMLLAVAATALLARRLPMTARPHRLHPMLVTLLGGMIGSLIFAPLAFAIEGLWPTEPAAAESEDFLDQWEQGGGLLALLAEWLSLLPPYLSSWMLVNALPLAAGRGVSPAPGIDRHLESPPSVTPAAPDCERPPEPMPPTSPEMAAEPGADDRENPFLASLPPAIGRDLVSIQADLHYLHVRTTRGRAMVLASLGTAELALAGRGLRVHRSHWVALAHVRRLARTASGMTLVLSDGSKVPVSRRRASEVRERLGHDFVVSAES